MDHCTHKNCQFKTQWHAQILAYTTIKIFSGFKKSHTCEDGHLRISVYLLMNLKNNYLLEKLLKWANKKIQCDRYWDYPLTTRKIKIFKKWKKHLEMSSFYTYALKITIKLCMLPEIWSVKDIFFCHFGPFLALSSQLLTPKIKIWKNVKKTWRCYAFTRVP